VAQKRGLNRAISRSGWGQLVARLQHKASGGVEQIPAAYTSQRCSACGHVAPENRKSQAVFECQACTAGRCNADVNAARNIAAGRAVTARETSPVGGLRTVNLNPLLLPHKSMGWVGIPDLSPGGRQADRSTRPGSADRMAPGDQGSASRRLRRRPHGTQESSFVWARAHHQAHAAQIAQPREKRIEHRTCGPA